MNQSPAFRYCRLCAWRLAIERGQSARGGWTDGFLQSMDSQARRYGNASLLYGFHDLRGLRLRNTRRLDQRGIAGQGGSRYTPPRRGEMRGSCSGIRTHSCRAKRLWMRIWQCLDSHSREIGPLRKMALRLFRDRGIETPQSRRFGTQRASRSYEARCNSTAILRSVFCSGWPVTVAESPTTEPFKNSSKGRCRSAGTLARA